MNRKIIHCAEAKKKLQELKEIESEFLKHFDLATKSTDTPQLKEKAFLIAQNSTTKLKESLKTFRREILLSSVEKAREIIGNANFIGPEEIDAHLKINFDDVPMIPYSPEQLKLAQEKGMMLVLHMHKDREGNDLTASKLNEMTHLENGTNILLDTSPRYKDEKYFAEDTCKNEWKLVENVCLKESFWQNYIGQTQILRERAKLYNLLSQEEEMECTDEILGNLKSLMLRGLKEKREVIQILSELKVNKHYRKTFIESFWDIAFTFLVHKRQSLINTIMTTSSISSSGDVVWIGQFNRTLGISVGEMDHLAVNGFVGVPFTF